MIKPDTSRETNEVHIWLYQAPPSVRLEEYKPLILKDEWQQACSLGDTRKKEKIIGPAFIRMALSNVLESFPEELNQLTDYFCLSHCKNTYALTLCLSSRETQDKAHPSKTQLRLQACSVGMDLECPSKDRNLARMVQRFSAHAGKSQSPENLWVYQAWTASEASFKRGQASSVLAHFRWLLALKQQSLGLESWHQFQKEWFWWCQEGDKILALSAFCPSRVVIHRRTSLDRAYRQLQEKPQEEQ